MVTYDLMLERQRLIGADKFSIAAHANETVCLRFNFDKSWRRFDSKAAVFKNQKGEFYIIEILQCRAKVPWEVLTQTGVFELSLIGYEDTSILSSDKVEIAVTESLLPEEYRTFSPSEVLFDRFKRECVAEAYLEYKDETEALKKAFAEEKLILGEKINEANKATNEAIEAKNEEIESITREYTEKINVLNSQITQLNSKLAYASEKAEKWDMVDYALGLKTNPASALWASGSGEYSLPMLNTSSISGFSAANFGSNLKSIGLDIGSVTSFSSAFLNHQMLQEIELKNTDSVISFESSFDGCSKLRRITLGNMDSCVNMRRFACASDSLERISFDGVLACNDMAKAFDGCLVLKVIDGTISFKNATNITSTFNNCFNLEAVCFAENTVKVNLDLSKCMKLTKESMLNIANALSPEVSCNLILSDYAFQNNFPAGSERSRFLQLVQETKGWTLNLD